MGQKPHRITIFKTLSISKHCNKRFDTGRKRQCKWTRNRISGFPKWSSKWLSGTQLLQITIWAWTFCSCCYNITSQYFLSVTCYLCQFIMECVQALHHETYFIFLEWEKHIYVTISSSTDVLFFHLAPKSSYTMRKKPRVYT